MEIKELNPELTQGNNSWTVDELTAAVNPLVTFANEAILTLLLCVYMLFSRKPTTVDSWARCRGNPHEMTLVEKRGAGLKTV